METGEGPASQAGPSPFAPVGMWLPFAAPLVVRPFRRYSAIDPLPGPAVWAPLVGAHKGRPTG